MALSGDAGMVGRGVLRQSRQRRRRACGLDRYVTQEEGTKLPPLSLLEPRELPDEGLAGATLGIADNQTTGGFLGHAYELTELIVPEDGDVAAAVAEALAAGKRFFIADVLAEDLLAIADVPGRRGGSHLQRPRPGRRAAHR